MPLLLRFIALRLLQTLLVVFVVVTLVFVVSRLVGHPEVHLLSIFSTDEERAAIREWLGVDRPIYVQYGEYLGDIIRLDFGYSFHERRPAIELIGDRAWATVKLGLSGLLLAIAVGVPMGVLMALRRGTRGDWLARLVAVFGQAIPNFWLGLILIYLVAVEVAWIPTGGADGIEALILPAITLAAFSTAAIARLTRSATLDVLAMEHVRTARAKGLPERTVIRDHVLRNAMLPVITWVGVALGQLVTSAVIVEIVFSWPGIGRFVLDAALVGDYPIVQTGVLILAASIALMNMLVDISYRLIDPRIRVEGL